MFYLMCKTATSFFFFNFYANMVLWIELRPFKIHMLKTIPGVTKYGNTTYTKVIKVYEIIRMELCKIELTSL